jgi:predicted lipid-binding transport protein (Tim44 family)
MFYLALGAAVLAFFTWLGRTPKLQRRLGAWRIVGGMASLVVFAAAAYLIIRGGWGTGLVLLALGFAVMLWTRTPRTVSQRAPALAMPKPGVAEARQILGVEPGASREEINAAYMRLIRMAHPDKGGTAGLAAQLNAARDRLLG